MQWLWIFYWPMIVLFPFILGIIAFYKKIYITSIIQIILSLIVPIYNCYFLVNSSWNGNKENEFAYLLKEVFDGNVESLFIIVGYLTIIGLCIYHFPKTKRKR